MISGLISKRGSIATASTNTNSHELKSFTILRHVNVPSKLLLDMSGHRIRGFRFAVRQKRFPGHAAFHPSKPAQDFLPVSVRGETADLCDTTFDRHPLSDNFYFGFTIEYATSDCARR